MKGFYKIAIVLIFALVISLSGFYLGYLIFSPDNQKQNSNIISKNEPIQEQTTQESELAAKVQEDKITPSTKMVYEYYYEDDNKVETLEEVPPYFLIDMTRQSLEENFKDWQIQSFSSKEVVMRKNIKGQSNQHYILGEYEGYVAVFYQKEINGVNLKEITDTPVSSLSEDEQARLREGISIDGNDELMKVLEDYSS